MSERQSVAVVGAGIVGLAHACAAVRRGHRVTVFERDAEAAGASIRNFGMVWPIGQPAGAAYATALESRRIWLEMGRESGLWVNPCGSIHLAHRADEWAVLEEFAAAAPALGYTCHLLTPAEVAARTDLANPEGLRGGLYSPTELGVNPRQALRVLSGWLADRRGVAFHFGTTITEVDTGRVRTAAGREQRFDRVVVCGGADFATLFPAVLAGSGLRRCKLQMLAVDRPSAGRLGTHLASGLTLRHYANFAVCASLEALRARIAEETPELDALGIHVMASQNESGALILGDSHEYDAAIEPFDKPRIDELIVRELKRVLCLPDWTITERWHGIYAKNPAGPVFEAEPVRGVHVCTGTGGSGMTMAFGLAERRWESWS